MLKVPVVYFSHIRLSIFSFLLFCLVLISESLYAETQWPDVAYSKDGSAISYEVYGSGEPTLVFVHGWSCDARYWHEQIEYFAKHHRIVLVDLAGHGHSSAEREKYTMAAFGEDVKAVAESVGSKETILIGHSMGGIVIAEAARLMPERIIGLIGIDTLSDVEFELTPEMLEQMTAPMKQDFKSGSRAFVASMLRPDGDAELQEWIKSDMSSADSRVAMSAMNEMMQLYITGRLAKLFDQIKVPVRAVNADLWPINVEANRRHMVSFEADVLENTDHFLMMNHSVKFNDVLAKSVGSFFKQDRN